jgi:hypothetical protein
MNETASKETCTWSRWRSLITKRVVRNVPVQIGRQCYVQSTDHKFIPTRNASLAAIQGSASGIMFVTIQRENIGPSKKEMNKAWTCPMFAVRLWITTSPFSLSYCFQSLRSVCSSSHGLLILGISVRIFLMQWFPLSFCMIVFRHTVGLLWTSDQPVAETSNCTGQHNIETQKTNIHALSGIRNRDPSNQAAADLRLRPCDYRGRLWNVYVTDM